MANCRLTSDCFMIRSKEKRRRFSRFKLNADTFLRDKRSNSDTDSFSSDSSLDVSNSLNRIKETNESG